MTGKSCDFQKNEKCAECFVNPECVEILLITVFLMEKIAKYFPRPGDKKNLSAVKTA
jgi:hypothetical protein